MDKLPSGHTLSRKELQWYAKQWRQPANGTTKSLRETYERIRSTACTPDYGDDAPSAPLAPPPINNDSKPAAASKPNKKQTSPPKKEKRLKKYRSSCSNATYQRIERALSQRLYLVQRGSVDTVTMSCDFVVLGSTGNVYTVRMTHLPTCSCPDNLKGHHCKHILFVLLKVMGIDASSPYIYQAALLTSELEEMFASMAARRVGGAACLLANEQVRSAYAKAVSGEPYQEDEQDEAKGGVQRKELDPESSDCPICFDPMTSSGSLTYCRAMCGANFHADCIRRWCQQHRANATCPTCRQPWQDGSTSSSSSPAVKNEGYTNLGAMQGQSPVRDTSTYSDWYDSYYGKRRRRW